MGARKDEKGLTVMRNRFCQEYAADLEGNATQAAVRAGFSERSAHVKASQMLDDPAVQREITRLNKATMLKLGINAVTVAREIQKLARANVLDYGRIDETGHFITDLTTVTRAQMAAVQEVSTTEVELINEGEKKVIRRHTRLKLFPKLPANELLSRATSGFAQKHEHSGKDGGPIHFTVERIASGKTPKSAGKQVG